MLSIIFTIILLLPLLVAFWLLYTFARFFLLNYINPWRESRGKKAYGPRICTIASILFALAFVL